MRFRNKSKEKGETGEKCAVISGVTGIICNTLLSAVKLTVGFLSGSVAVISDGFNNFSDAAVNIVTIVGAKLSRKPNDREHPFGHGRIEYIAALIVAFSIFTVSVELLRESAVKIFNPEPPEFSAVYIIALSGTIAVKLLMALQNHRLYKLSGSVSLKAVRQDSLNDCITTSATIASLILVKLFGIAWIDGAMGVAVSVLIFMSGVFILRDILDPLIGQAPSRETMCRIEEIILNSEHVLGVTDIKVHSYGSANVLASARASVPAGLDLVTVHNMIDRAEKQINEEMGISITIHIDPV